MDEEFEAAPLDEVLGEVEASETDAATAEPEQTAEAEPAGEEPQADEPNPDAPPASDEPTDRNVPFTAYEAERQKRQDIERQLQALKQQPAQQEPELDEDLYWEDPAKVIDQTKDELRREMQTEVFNTRLGISEDMMRTAHEDYDETVKVFEQLVGNNPGHPLAQQLLAAPNPAKFAYDTAKQYSLVSERTAPDYEEKMREQIKAELLAEMNGGTPETPSPKALAPTSLASIPSTGNTSKPAWAPKPIDDILPE